MQAKRAGALDRALALLRPAHYFRPIAAGDVSARQPAQQPLWLDRQVITLPIAPLAKARPRFVRATGRTYMPKDYMAWKAAVAALVAQHWNMPPLPGVFHLHVHFVCVGTWDGDNLIGAVMDACRGVLWSDDRVTVIPRGSWSWEPCKQGKGFIRITLDFDGAHGEGAQSSDQASPGVS